MTAAVDDPVAQARAVIEHCYEQGWSDGLPVVPATDDALAQFLATTGRDPGEVIGTQRHLERSVTVAQAAVNAIMAGCRADYFPVVLAAWDALQGERAATGGAWQSTSGPSPLIVVNGPVRERIGVNSASGVLGPGFRANATIARAIGMIVRNAYRIRPQELDQTTQGIPGRWTLCIGEHEELSPWEPLSVVGGLEADVDAVSAMLVRSCEYIDNRSTTDAEDILRDLADTIARTGAWVGPPHSSGGVILGPEHAQMLAAAGYGRGDVQQRLFELAVRSHRELAAAGKAHGLPDTDDPDRRDVPMVRAAQDITLVVAGAANAAMSTVFRPFGWLPWSGRSVPVRHPGKD